ncbi:biotin--[acetyl-CoA-carboxylase] ligase [Sphingobacterium sp.]|uniref:biotin--[acetyl-CoA-carboxylase] ligase n=1 Tax=Sphingobacterium sp. TaxID=341027 RepID=UPI0031D0FE3A
MQNNNISGLIIGQNTIYLDKVASTNDYLRELMSKFTPLAEGTAILAEEQFQGKGQRGSVWVSEPGKNLTTSILLKPYFLPIAQQFALSATIAIAVVKWLKCKTEQDIAVKWPNDIYVGNKKIAGILIENKLKGNKIEASIVGIGININQVNFDTATTITSLAVLTNRADYVIRDLATELFESIQKEYNNLFTQSWQSILNRYNESLFWRDQKRQFLIAGEKKTGIIKAVEIDGRLQVLIDGKLQQFEIKEISHLIS